jgi:hypothetical protein
MAITISGTTGISGVDGSASTPALIGTDADTGFTFTAGLIGAGLNGVAARVPAMHYYRLDSTLAGSNVSTAQSVFGVGVTLGGSLVYEFESMFALSKTTGTTSHTISLGFGGTATLNGIAFQVNTAIAPSGLATGGTASIYEFQTAGGGVVDAAQSTAGMHFMALVKGTVSINAGGTFIPQYTLSAAPGGAYSTIQSSFFKIAPLSASGANTSIGTWS